MYKEYENVVIRHRRHIPIHSSSLCPSLTRALVRTEGTDGGTILSQHQILPCSCTRYDKHPRVETQILLLRSVSVHSIPFLCEIHACIYMSAWTAIFTKFLLKCCFEVRKEYKRYDLLWTSKFWGSFPVYHSTLLSFLALTEIFWVHLLLW